MTRCWSCGSEIPGGARYFFTCPACEAVEVAKSQVKSQVPTSFDELARVQLSAFEKLSNRLSDKLSEIATLIEWGFDEIVWQLEQQTEILQNIDHTLKTPSETQANEWRRMAEELRSRGVLDKSEKLFLKALGLNPLDYRIYVGLAQTYIQTNRFKKAKVLLEKSIPHAPKYNSFDYKSYSYRLIGRIYFCGEKYKQATKTLKLAVELSPNCEDAHYDYAQYCALIRKRQEGLISLQKAILAKPLYFHLAEKERNFDPLRHEVKSLLAQIMKQAIREAREVISKAESEFSVVKRSLKMYRGNIKRG